MQVLTILCKCVMAGFWLMAAIFMLPFAMIAAIFDLLFGERIGTGIF